MVRLIIPCSAICASVVESTRKSPVEHRDTAALKEANNHLNIYSF